jgi:hypothetical protein
MSRLTAPRLALASLMTLGVAASAVITLTPATYDYGDTAVRGWRQHDFTVALPPGTPRGTLLTFTTTGPDAPDFFQQVRPPMDVYGECSVGSQGIVCTEIIDFVPTSLGPKVATLVVTDNKGNRATAQLKGKGVAALCEMKVVFCNYAHLYDGTFRWKTSLSGGNSYNTETVDVTIVKGVATCNGSATDAGNGQSTTGPITGPGLVAVEFDADSTMKPVYRITVACPSPDWPPTADNPKGTPSRPAELGHTEQKTYDQPSPGTGMDLIGSSSYPAPETDSASGVSGQVDVSWSLKRRP